MEYDKNHGFGIYCFVYVQCQVDRGTCEADYKEMNDIKTKK